MRQGAARRVLLRVFLGSAQAARQGLARLSECRLEPHFNQKALAMVGAAFILEPVNRRAGAGGLQVFLERGLVVAQSGAAFELGGKALCGLADHLGVDKGAHRIQAAIEKHRPQNGFHGVRKHGRLAPNSAAIFAAAEQNVPPQIDRGRHLRHVLAAYQLSAHPRQVALAPAGKAKKQGFAHNQAKNRVPQKLKPLIAGGIGGFRVLLMRQGSVGEGAQQQLRARKAVPERRFQFAERCFHCQNNLEVPRAIGRPLQLHGVPPLLDASEDLQVGRRS